MKKTGLIPRLKEGYATFSSWMEEGPLGGSLSKARRVWLFLDFLRIRLFRKTSLEDYVRYEFYLLNRRGRAQYIDWGKRQKLVRYMNKEEDQILFDDKGRFNQRFAI